MERSSKRGKIPQQDWPSIMARYEAGETLSSIARTYDCSPPAISYIVSRSRARSAAPGAAAPSAPISSEPQLVKGHAAETPAPELPQIEGIADDPRVGNLALDTSPRVEGPAAEEPRPDDAPYAPNPQNDSSLREGDRPTEQYGSGRDNADEPEYTNSPRSFDPTGVPAQNSEPQRTLHLSLSHGNDAPAVPDLQSPSKHSTSLSGEGVPLSPAGGHRSFSQSGRQAAAGNGAAARVVSEPQITEDSRAFIDQTLRERVESDITAFLAAFDAALTRDTPESRAGLREATDRLLRAGARTRIELERLEARVPLSSPNRGRQQDPAWRQHRPAR